MAKIFNVSYDLNQPGQNYSGLTKVLQAYDSMHILGSTWLVCTSQTAQQVSDNLRANMDNNDHLLVAEFGSDYAGWLPKNFWEWVNSRKAAYSFR